MAQGANIEVYNQSTIYLNNSVINYGQLPISDVFSRTIDISNLGDQNLSINQINLTTYGNSSYIVNNPVTESSISISPNQKISFDIIFDTQILGVNNHLLQIGSNASNFPVFIINFIYDIKPQFNLKVAYNGIEKLDREIVDLGGIQKSEERFDILRITNSGIKKNIKIIAINYGDNVISLNQPLLPFVLNVSERNSYQIALKFNTNTKGKKISDLDIQWESID